MKLYIKKNQKLNELKEKTFKLERDIQELFEFNLNEIMNLTLVKSEFTIKKTHLHLTIKLMLS